VVAQSAGGGPDWVRLWRYPVSGPKHELATTEGEGGTVYPETGARAIIILIPLNVPETVEQLIVAGRDAGSEGTFDRFLPTGQDGRYFLCLASGKGFHERTMFLQETGNPLWVLLAQIA